MALDLIVIGGSAGALEPLLEILGALPAGVTAPVVVAMHLHPSSPSLMAPLLHQAAPGRRAREADDKEPLRPGAIHVAPPNYHLLVERRGTLALSIDEPVHFSRPSIDVLFESAAHAYGAAVAGVLLSGTNADGAAGLVRIAARGGAAIVQADAAYPYMPEAARRLVPSAHELAAGEIASHLARLAGLPPPGASP